MKTALLIIFLFCGICHIALADVQNLQISENQRPVSVETGNPAIVTVSPNSYLYGELDTSSYPAITCQLEKCIWQIDSEGYTGYHVKFSGLALNNTAIVAIGGQSYVFQPKPEVETVQDPVGIPSLPEWSYLAVGGAIIAIVAVIATRRKSKVKIL